MTHKQRILGVLTVAAIAAVLAVGALLHRSVRHMRLDNQYRDQISQIKHLSTSIQDDLFRRFKSATGAMNQNRKEIQASLDHAADRKQSMVGMLNGIQAALDARFVFILDSSGTMTACSEHGGGKSLVGQNYGFRPYFQQSIHGKEVAYPAIGVATGERGLYFSSPIFQTSDTKPQDAAVMVIKAGFDAVDEALQSYTKPAMLLSPDGIVLAANRPEWLFRSTKPISPVRRDEIRRSRQFDNKGLHPVEPALTESTVEIGGHDYRIAREPVYFAIPNHPQSSISASPSQTPWEIVTLHQVDPGFPLTAAQKNLCGTLGIIIALLGAGVTLLLVNIAKRRAAEIALQQANDRLEGRVLERTEELQVANRRLKEHINERHRAEAELRDRNEFIETVTENLPIGLVVSRRDTGEILYANKRLEEIYGWKRNLFPTADAMLECLFPDDTVREEFKQRIQEGRTESDKGSNTVYRDVQITRQDGRQVYVTATNTPLNKDSLALSTVMDVTDRIEAEHKLRDSRERYRALFELSNDAIYLRSFEGEILQANSRAAEMFGYEPNELVGKSIIDFVNPAQVPAAREAMQRTVTSGSGRSESSFVRADGSLVDVTLSARVIDEASRIIQVIACDISEQKRTEAELRWAKEMAEAGNRAKSEFLANVSHEMRTPLNGLLGMTALLAETDLSAEQREYATTIESSGIALAGVIRNLLDFAQIDSGRLELAHVPTDVRQITESVLLSLDARAERKELKVVSQIDSRLPTDLAGDPERLRQILEALTDNALKFTSSGYIAVTVDVTTATDAETTVRFAVNDTGIGVPADKVTGLFESFSQVDPSSTRKYGGTGLGLAISKQLVEAMGGQIGVESIENEGSTFWFTACLAKQSASADVSAPAVAPPRPAGADQPDLLNVLDALKRMENDEELLRSVLKEFLQQIPSMIGMIRQAADSADAEALVGHAHSIKGAAASVGAEGVRSCAETMEMAARQGQLGDFGSMVDDLNRLFVETRSAADDFIGESSR